MGPGRDTRSEPQQPARPTKRRCSAGLLHTTDGVWSRRRFFRAAAGAATAAAVVGSDVLRPATVSASGPGIGLAEPIPTTIEFFPGVFGNVQAPPLTGVDTDPSTVTNFSGAAAIAFISGQVDRRNRRTDEVRTLPFLFTDMRFMKGVFRGRDGHEREAAFAFIWIDVFDPQLGNPPVQVHDFNPGVRQNGLFWTTIVSGDAVDVDLDAGTGTLEVSDIFQKDYFDFENAFLGNGGKPEPGRVSFRVEWTADGPPLDVDNPGQQYRGTVQSAQARMSWSGRSGDYEFQSAPIETSTTDAAQIGSCHNGSYYA